MDAHAPFLQRCLELARLPGAEVEPNPRVGAVLVRDGRIIGEGWHRRYGGPHAEVEAADSVADKALLRECTLYVSLEPCNHHGKTPPCTDLILRHAIPRVVVGSIDPNPAMGGKSLALLRAAGVEVTLADDQAPFQALNRHFWLNQRRHRPYITLKWAASADGFIAARDAQGLPTRTTITGPACARLTHWLRHEHHAILIGAGTALIDRPTLDTRHFPGRSPVPIVLDRDARLPLDAPPLSGKPRALVVRGAAHPPLDGASVMAHAGELDALLARLYAEERIGSILVEGGAEVLGQFIGAGLWDEAWAYTSGVVLGNGLPGPVLPDAAVLREEFRLGGDLVRVWAPGT